MYLGELLPFVFYGGLALATVLNLPVFIYRKCYVSIDREYLKVAGFRPMRLDEIDHIEIGRGALQRPTLRIFSKSRRIPISSVLAASGLSDL
jgi:hypothetical protein